MTALTPVEEAAVLSIEKMFKKGWFDITVIDDVCDALGCPPGGPEYRTLRLLHCVDFKDMPRKLFRELPALINSVVYIGGRRITVIVEDDPRVINA